MPLAQEALAANFATSDFETVPAAPGTPGTPDGCLIDGPNSLSNDGRVFGGSEQLSIDRSCTVKNFSCDNPLNSTLNFASVETGTLIVFDNVCFGGNFACANVEGKASVWAVNGSDFSTVREGCQDLIIPVEKIEKQAENLAGTPISSVTVGVPFVYTLDVPVLYDPVNGTILESAGSLNDIDSVVIQDDLSLATLGVDLELLSVRAFYEDENGVTTAMSRGADYLLNNSGSDKDPGILTFEIRDPTTLPAGAQVHFELEVVLEDSPANIVGKSFTNIATWEFARIIDGTRYDPLPGENGVAQLLSISGPDLVLSKTTSATAINFADTPEYTLAVQNVGGAPAWNILIEDEIPLGMRDFDPSADVALSMGGVTLIESADYTVSYDAASGLLNIELLDNAGALGPNEILEITYRSQLDQPGMPNEPADGEVLTNVAGATVWYNDSSSNSDRVEYSRTRTDGTVGTDDHQDAESVTAALTGYYFEKIVSNATTGESPSATAAPGDRVRYTLRLFNLSEKLFNAEIRDQLDGSKFDLSSVVIDQATCPAGGTCSIDASGLLTITGDLDVLPNSPLSSIEVDFEVDLLASLSNGEVVSNQAQLNAEDADVGGTAIQALSDDPYDADGVVNQADPQGESANPTNITIFLPAPLLKVNPAETEVAIGESFAYEITIPAPSVSVFDVKIHDTLPTSLEFVSASALVGGVTEYNLSNTGSANELILENTITGLDVPAGNETVVTVSVRLKNQIGNQDGNTFSNTAYYTFSRVQGGSQSDGAGTEGSTGNMTIVEPELSAHKTVTNITRGGTTAAQGGDILEYAVTLTNNGTSPAYDVSITDTLPAGLVLQADSERITLNGGATLSKAADVSGSELNWGRESGDEGLDILVGQSLVLTYRVQVASVSGSQLTNSVIADYTSMDGAEVEERNGSGAPDSAALNDYFVTASSTLGAVYNVDLTKSFLADSWNSDGSVRVGDTVEFELKLDLDEGSHRDLVLADNLPVGMAFVEVVSANYFGSAPADLPVPVVSSDQRTITWTLDQVDNPVDGDASNDFLTIVYRARVLNGDVLAQLPITQALTNNATLDYLLDGSPAAQLTTSATINVIQPVLTVTKSAVTSVDGDNSVRAGERATYTVDITNSGAAPAFDAVLVDVLPLGLREGGVTTVSATLVGSGTDVAVTPAYDAATGTVTWDFDGAAGAAINPGEVLRVVYEVVGDADLGAGLTLTNSARVTRYYSFDNNDVPVNSIADWREEYGPTEAATFDLITPMPGALRKATSQTSVAIGESLTYTITIPDVPIDTALQDVQIMDDLTATGVDLNFVSATLDGQPLLNSGTSDNLVLYRDGGLNIPAGEQVEVLVTVEVLNTQNNRDRTEPFINRAWYDYDNGVERQGDDATRGDDANPVTIVHPELVVAKTGPASMRIGTPDNFTLVAENIGESSAWNVTLSDFLPNPAPGGICAVEPVIQAAQIEKADSSTVVLSASDFLLNFVAGEPACEFTATLQTDDALEPGDRLVVSYQAELDDDNLNGITLANVAGATEWFSGDASNSERVAYQRQLTDGTPGVIDHQDNHEFLTEAAILETRKSVFNVTTGGSGANARPGDRLRYTIEIENISDLPQNDFTLTDELDRLNGIAMFEAGSITIDNAQTQISSDASINVVNDGGAQSTGLVEIIGLDISPSGETGDTLTVVFEATLAQVITSNTIVFNQAQLSVSGVVFGSSDDPLVEGNEDPTETLISSSPLLAVEKVSEDISGDGELLLAGDTLRYTIRVQNSGSENTGEAILFDQVPANTTYVANSTTLNGFGIADISGESPLATGLTINTPGAAEGVLLADPEDPQSTEAVITFDVTINDVAEGTLISNQGFVTGEGAGSGPYIEVPSDDPATDTPEDPTIDIVGDVPALVVQKVVALQQDNLSQGIVDPGDTLRYTIVVENRGGVDSTEASLTDLIPANTTYVAGSTTLNGIAVSDNGGDARIATGLPIASEDLMPPLPGALEGVISSGRTATIVFDVTVDAGTATGTVISNQGSVDSAELPLVLTDADGNPANGAQPTEVVVGDAQQLAIVKEVSVVNGAAEAGATLEYLVTVTNISAVPATNVVITDDLLVAGDGALSYVADSARLNGQSDGITVNGSVISADYSAVFGELQPEDTATLRFQARLGADLAIGTTVVNTAMVEWNDPPSSTQASVSIDVGGTPGIANLAGYLWRDVNFNTRPDTNEQLLQNWTVELYFNGNLVETAQSDENGYFQFDGLLTNMTGGASYELRYVAAGAGVNTASLGNADSDFTNGPQQITEIYVGSGANLQDLNLPLTPNGVVYDSVVRGPVAGATLTMLRASSGVALPDSCFDDPRQQGQVTQTGGFYKFDINFSGAGCPAGSDYLIQVELPGGNYVAGESAIIPPQTNAETAGFDVAACLGSAGDAVPATTEHCEAQPAPGAPPIDIDAQSPATNYYLRLRLDDNRVPGESQLFNNHIAVDPQLDGALSITKTSSMLNVTRSQLVPYTITFSNTLGVPLTDLELVDFFPAGFKYVPGSARVDGVAIEPEVEGLQLRWSGLRIDPQQTRTAKLLLVVSSGVGEGEYVNRAQLFNGLSGQVVSGEAFATVRVIPDPTFDCTDVIGKVYDDKNMNGYQDAGEGGVPGARVVTATGLNATTDAHGRFHITCAVVPDQNRGSNFVLKLDDRSLPSGYRLTSENPRVVRATRGKMIKVNFGSSLHRVVRLDMAEGVFEPERTEMRPQWHSRTELLLEKLQEAPSVLRLSYLAENEDPDLVERRLQVMKARIADEWARDYGDYELTIETEVFWRRGAPPSRGGWK